MDEIDDLITEFKEKLNQDITEIELIDRHLIFGTPYIFRDDEYIYFTLKEKIATYFGVSNTEIYMIGSAKLGFSISPKKLWRKINDDSDIDMVIISEKLFDEFWIDLLDFRIELTSRSEKDDIIYKKFLEYFFKGWLRPDLFPFKYKDRNIWFDFFKSISYKDYDKRKISCAIFRNEHFFKKYHVQNIQNIRKIRTEEEM